MSARPQPAASEGKYCSIACECGKKCGNYLHHYDLLRCDCGRMYWALQPLCGGPLVLKVWPGPNFTRQEMEGMAA